VKYSKDELIRLYKKETNIKVKERMLLVIKVKYENVIPAYAADELHRSRPWGLYWLDRFSQEGVEGLKNRPKSGRHPDIPEEKIHEIKNELASNKQGWTTKQVEDLIIRKRVEVQDTIIPTFTDSCTSGDSNRKYHEKYM
jgi:putative transposase